MEECTIELIKIIFKNYKEYTPLKKATEQLLTLIKNETIEYTVNCSNKPKNKNLKKINLINFSTITIKKTKR